MSILALRKIVEIPAIASRADSAVLSSALSAILGFARKTIVGVAKLFLQAAQAFAEARMQRTNIEIEFYRNRYKHSSKNDDDLPMVR